jgi:hypothetical protein
LVFTDGFKRGSPQDWAQLLALDGGGLGPHHSLDAPLPALDVHVDEEALEQPQERCSDGLEPFRTVGTRGGETSI